MSNKNEDSKIWKAVGVMAVIAVVGYYAYNSCKKRLMRKYRNNKKPMQSNSITSLCNCALWDTPRRKILKIPLVTIPDPSTPCGEWLTAITCTLKQNRYNVPQSVCFYRYTERQRQITSYAPEFKTISVDMKIDGEKPYHLPLKETTDPRGCVFFLLLVSYATFKTRVI
ncbi:hypothetical protein IANJMKHF_00464 [Klebsiella phage CPRSA]|nr:hypothetical protein IANJMKHF_00464 [Klebsiella phage CPRSA]